MAIFTVIVNCTLLAFVPLFAVYVTVETQDVVGVPEIIFVSGSNTSPVGSQEIE